MAIAPRKPAASYGPATRWSLDEIATALHHPTSGRAMSRSTIWRILDAADLKPPRSVDWLHRHDPVFALKARALCDLYVDALRFYQQDRLVLCTDAKTGRQILQRTYPTPVPPPGQPEKREHEDMRHGTRGLLAAFLVPPGPVGWTLSPTRTREDCAAHLTTVVAQLPKMARYDWGLDNLNTPWSLEVCRVVAAWCALPCAPKTLERGVQRRAFLSDPTPKPGFHCTPTHGAWLNQVAGWCSGLARRFLPRGDCGAVEDFATQLCDSLEVYNTHHAHPYRWPSTGPPLVRATPFSHTRRQQRHGRAWLSPRPQRFERILSPPRPYHRTAVPLAANL